MGDLGFGILLKEGDGASPEVFTAIAELTGLSGPGFSMDTVETTHTESANNFRQFIAGLLDAGEVSADLNFLPANATQSPTAGIMKTMMDRTNRNFQIVWPDSGSSTWTISAYVTAFEPSSPIDDRMTASVSLKITGKPTFS